VDGPLTAGDLVGRFDLSRPAVAEHLQVLRRAGLVRDEPSGRQRHYHLTAENWTLVWRLVPEVRAPACSSTIPASTSTTSAAATRMGPGWRDTVLPRLTGVVAGIGQRPA
jgi:DNA-binding MarR family transcriptional regulator